MDLELLETRARIIRAVRSFFEKKDYLEVDTPLLAPDLIPESCLEVFQTALVPPDGSTKETRYRYLVPSPEIWMKKLIARHKVSMYQICKCFRNGEQEGRLHSPEFTMLEYYTAGADYLDSLALTEELFRHISGVPLAVRGPEEALAAPFLRITMEDAFVRWAGFSLAETAAQGRAALETQARRLGIDLNPNTPLNTAALYDLIFIHAVEPNLPKDRPVALMDYPAFVPCLARDKSGGGAYAVKERWELYVNGIELANCYTEETDGRKVKDYFEAEQAEKEKTAMVPHPVDSGYWKLFEGRGFPACSGVAMGLDRFVMAVTGKSSIDAVLPFG
jgi:lysyl-tRNA synthetase class 2